MILKSFLKVNYIKNMYIAVIINCIFIQVLFWLQLIAIEKLIYNFVEKQQEKNRYYVLQQEIKYMEENSCIKEIAIVSFKVFHNILQEDHRIIVKNIYV